jgi:hypothetical protein
MNESDVRAMALASESETVDRLNSMVQYSCSEGSARTLRRLLKELGLGMPRRHAQVNQSLRAPPPTFHQPPPIEHLGDQGIAWT